MADLSHPPVEFADPSIAGWLDDGSFARWCLADLPEKDTILDDLRDLLDPSVMACIDEALAPPGNGSGLGCRTNRARSVANSVSPGILEHGILLPARTSVTYKPGDRVVYPHHGAAVIEKKEKRSAFGEERDYLVLRMAHGDLVLSVPVDKVEQVGMRWPISTEDVEDLFEVLGKRDVREPANWSRRFKNHQEKLKSGDVYQVAEVVRNLALRNNAKGLSAGEKSLYTKARTVLISELAFALDVDEEIATTRVDNALV